MKLPISLYDRFRSLSNNKIDSHYLLIIADLAYAVVDTTLCHYKVCQQFGVAIATIKPCKQEVSLWFSKLFYFKKTAISKW